MRNLRNERGVALVTSLLLTLISLAIVMALLYMITWQTQLSAAHKRYKTAIEASHGGAEIFAMQVIPSAFSNITGATLATQFPGIGLQEPSGGGCLQYKLSNNSANWSAVCGTDSSPFDPKVKPDATFVLPGAQTNFKVYAKIVDAVPGNSDTQPYNQAVAQGLLDSGGGVVNSVSGSGGDTVQIKHIPGMYRIEVEGEKEVNAKENAGLSILYAY